MNENVEVNVRIGEKGRYRKVNLPKSRIEGETIEGIAKAAMTGSSRPSEISVESCSITLHKPPIKTKRVFFYFTVLDGSERRVFGNNGVRHRIFLADIDGKASDVIGEETFIKDLWNCAKKNEEDLGKNNQLCFTEEKLKATLKSSNFKFRKKDPQKNRPTLNAGPNLTFREIAEELYETLPEGDLLLECVLSF